MACGPEITETFTTLKRCCGCKWWKRDTLAGFNCDYGECEAGANMNEMGEPPKQNGVSDMELGHVFTGPEFGCVHWEART